MATKTTKTVAKTTTTKARAKTVGRPTRSARPADIDARIADQDTARAAWEAARDAHDTAVEKGRSPEMVAKFAEARRDAWEAFVGARFLRWGTLHAERAINRGDGEFPQSVFDDSAGIRTAIIEVLTAHLNYERGRAGSDPERVKAIAAALKGARANLRD